MKVTRYELKSLNGVELKETFYQVEQYDLRGSHVIIANTPRYAVKIDLIAKTYNIIELKRNKGG